MSKILIVEDQKHFRDVIRDWLTAQGYLVDCAETGPDALLYLKQYEYDLIILDMNLPGLSGIDVCRNFRQRGGVTPIIFSTVNQHIDDKELGFDAGADDYLIKPFNMRELSARIKAMLKRSAKSSREEVLKVGAITLNSEEHTICVASKAVELQPKEFALLEFLMRNPNRVFNAEVLLQRVWPTSSQASAETIRSHITRIRQKLGFPCGDMVVTVHGVGYKFVSESKSD